MEPVDLTRNEARREEGFDVPDARDSTVVALGSRRRFSVMEVFGPTIQGEGPDAGRPCVFVRFGGCDFRCEWCDSMFAVDPASVRVNAQRMTANGIALQLRTLHDNPPEQMPLVVLSGGNPALQHAGDLVHVLHGNGYDVAVETQGTVWRPWLADVDSLVVSPKPPSSGMDTGEHRVQLIRFMGKAVHAWRTNPTGRPVSLALKVVVFDDADYRYARTIHETFPDVPFYLSVGTDPPEAGESYGSTLLGVAGTWKWLAERVAGDPAMHDAKVLPQLHVIAWGHARGV